MIINAGTFRIHDGGQADVRDALLDAREASLAEDGVTTYDFGFDIADDTLVRLFEVYDDLDAFRSHMAADHTRALFVTLGEHLDGRPSMTLYDATETSVDVD